MGCPFFAFLLPPDRPGDQLLFYYSDILRINKEAERKIGMPWLSLSCLVNFGWFALYRERTSGAFYIQYGRKKRVKKLFGRKNSRG